jgi:hypothetical protein
MESNGPLDALPLWGVFVAILIVVLLSVECGYRLGRYRRNRHEQEKETPVGTMVGATLGLLAFILAFTFGLAAARFDTRRQVLLDEANAIGTTYLRAGMLPERREEIRALLRNYVDTRLEAVRSGNIAEGMRQSENIQNDVWTHAIAVGEKNPNSIVVGLFVQSLNDMIDLHAKRVQGKPKESHSGRNLGSPFRGRSSFARDDGLPCWLKWNPQTSRNCRSRHHILCGDRANCRSGPASRGRPEGKPAGSS